MKTLIYTTIITMLILGTIKISGIKLLYVTSNSMKPTFQKNDLLISVPIKSVAVGNIVSFIYKHSVYSHRIISIEVTEGKSLIRTKGDNNKDRDPDPVLEKEILGKVVFVIPLHAIKMDTALYILYPIIGYLLGFIFLYLHI